MKKRGQYLVEVAVLFGLVILAIAGMQTYVRRSVQAKLKNGIDVGVAAAQGNITNLTFPVDDGTLPAVPSGPKMQYEPYYVNDQIDYSSKQATRENVTGVSAGSEQGNITQEAYSQSQVDSQGKTDFNMDTESGWSR